MAISCRDFNLSCIIIAIDTWHYVDWMRGYGDPEQSSDQMLALKQSAVQMHTALCTQH